LPPPVAIVGYLYWELTTKYQPYGLDRDDYFGYFIAISENGDIVLGGTPGKDDNGCRHKMRGVELSIQYMEDQKCLRVALVAQILNRSGREGQRFGRLR